MEAAPATNDRSGPRPVSFARPPRWAVAAAYAVPLCLLPSALWRVQLVVTSHLSYGWYLLLLSAAEVGLGLLTLGLVHSWGEVLPRWVPLLGGRRIPTRAAVIPATIGAIAVTLICAYGAFNWFTGWAAPQTVAEARALSGFPVPDNADLTLPGGWVPAFYAPSLAWGPLLAAVTWAYHRRRTQPHQRLPR